MKERERRPISGIERECVEKKKIRGKEGSYYIVSFLFSFYNFTVSYYSSGSTEKIESIKKNPKTKI